MSTVKRLHAAALAALLGCTVVHAATVTGISPQAARLDAAQYFTVTGTGLTAGSVSLEHCRVMNAAAGTATEMRFQCLPERPGAKKVLLNGADTGLQAKVVVEHPLRTGNPSARGIPALSGASLFNGNYHLTEVDMSVPTKGMPFVLSRSYNSYDWSRESKRGAVNNQKPWRFNWEVSVGWVADTQNTQIYVQQADGSSHTYVRMAGNVWQPIDPGNFNRLELGSSSVVVTTRAGVKQTFELPGPSGGRLKQVADVHGLAFVLDHGANGKVSRVRDPSGLFYNFGYDTGHRLVSVTDYFGRVVRYGWECGPSKGVLCAANSGPDAYERIASVTEARSGADDVASPPVPVRTTTYHYDRFDPPSDAASTETFRLLLVRVSDPAGKPVVQMQHSFGAYGNWGVSSIANGVGNAWGIRYCADTAASESDPEVCDADVTRARRFRTTVTPPIGAERRTIFDTAGRLVASIDGRELRSAAESVPTASLTDADYNKAALPLKRQSPLGVQNGYATRFEHQATIPGLLTKLSQFAGGSILDTITTWATGAAQQQRNLFCSTSSQSPEGLVRTLQRDDLCRTTAMAEPGKPAATLTYGKAGMPSRVSQVIDARLGLTKLDYDNVGNHSSTVGPMGETSTTTYDRIGRPVRQVNPLLGVTVTAYEGSSQRVRRITDPLNRVTQFEYDLSGNLEKRIAPNGQVTNYEYDAANRLVRTTTTVTTATGPQVVSTQTVYDALGRVKQVINANNHASTTTFDDAGNALARANALGQATSYEYDADNRVTKVTDAAGRVTETIYDELGRVTSVTTPAGSQGYDYDRDGRVVRHVDARGLATQYFYDPATGHLVKVIDAAGRPTTATYDEAGNNRSITDPNGNTTWFEYDKSNRRTKRTDPNGDVWTWEYDKAGNVRYARAPGGLVVESIYDVAGQLKEQRRQPENQIVSFDYDANGNRIRMTDATGVTSYAYDGINRLTQVTDPRGKVLKFAYDPAGNRTAITYPHNKVVGYGYDAADRLISVSDWLGRTHRYTLNAAGQVTQLELGNGTRETRSYDAASRLTSLVNSGPGGAVISSHTLQMDPNGNIVEAAVQLPLLPSFGPGTKTMTYDAANRLTSVDGQPVTHDSAGRLTSIGSDGYAYDSRDLLTTITGPNAGTNTYNGAGHRVARSNAAGTTRYVIDPSAGNMFSVLQENDGSDNLLRSYIHGYGLLMQISAADVPRYYHFDPTGHTLALTDQTGVTTDKYAHTPYGETTASGPTANPFRFVGKFGVMDEANGLHFMRSRFFRSAEGRFSVLDPIGDRVIGGADFNRYAYAMSSPLILKDPTGQYSWTDTLNLGLGALDFVSAGATLGLAAPACAAAATVATLAPCASLLLGTASNVNDGISKVLASGANLGIALTRAVGEKIGSDRLAALPDTSAQELDIMRNWMWEREGSKLKLTYLLLETNQSYLNLKELGSKFLQFGDKVMEAAATYQSSRQFSNAMHWESLKTFSYPVVEAVSGIQQNFKDAWSWWRSK